MTVYDELGRAHLSIRKSGVDIAIDADGNSTLVDEGTDLWQTQSFYDSKGRVTMSVSADGQRTEYEYDSLGRRVATYSGWFQAADAADGGTIKWFRHKSVTNYDTGDSGRVVSEVTGIIVKQNLDNSGLVTDSSHAVTTSFDYDHLGNVIRTTVVDASTSTTTTMQASFDAQGRKLSETNQMGQTRTFEYDSLGRLTAVELPAVEDPHNPGSTVNPRYEYAYDADGNQTLIRDPLGRETVLAYDEVGRQTSRTLPLGFGSDGQGGDATGDFVESFEYDARGRQVLAVSFEGVHTVNVYDNVTGRMTERKFFADATEYNGGAGTAREKWTYGFDDYGRVITVAALAYNAVSATYDTVRTESRSYDAEGRLETVTSDEGTITYGYDDFGRQTSVSSYLGLQSAETSLTTYSYDELGRLKTVTAVERNGQAVDIDPNTAGDQSDETTYVYDTNGNLDAMVYSNGVVHDYEYDDRNRLDLLRHFEDVNENGQFDAGTDNLLAEFDYTVRDDGRRSGAVEKYFDDGGTTPFEQNTFTWTYDDLGRLIGEVLDSSDNTLDYADTFEWDVVGNRLETSRDWGDVANNDYTTTYQYDANDRLTVETKDHVATSVPDVVTTYSYDHTQQTGKSVVTDGVPTSNQIFEYDLQGRMASVTNQTLDSGGNVVGVQTTEYEYDTTGNRVVATNTVDANNDGTPESVTRTEYLTDTSNPTGYSQMIEETEFDDQGNPVKKIVYTIGHDQISQTVFTHDGTNWDSGETHHFGYDGHGSVRVLYDAMAAMVTSATNNILQLFHFDAHGNLLNMQAVEALTSYLYSGEAFDSNIGQQYLRARWYDASTGRFNRLDPFFGNLSDPQSLHKYLYVHGDPVNGVDPSGLFSLASRGAVIGITSGLSALSGLAIFQSAGRNPIRGAVLGGLGGLALSLAFFSGRLPRVAGEAMGALAIVTASSLLRDEVARLYGVGGRRSVASLAADGFEAFMFGAFNAEASIGIGGIDELYESPFYDETGVHFLQAFSTLALSAGAAFLSVSGSLLRGLQLRLTTSQQDMGAAKAEFRAVLKEELVNLVKVIDAKNGPSPLGNALNALAAASTTRLGKLPLVRNLPPRLRLLLQQNMNEVVIMTGVQFLDQQFGFQLQERINEGARQVGDQIVDLIFD